MKFFSNNAGFSRAAVFVALAILSPMLMTTSEVNAQGITATIEGTIVQPDGQPAVGVSATITDVRDGARRTVSADSRGVVVFRGISAGGPYSVRIAGANYEDILVTDLFVDIDGTSSFSVALQNADAAIDEITVTASQVSVVTVASGPSSSFSLEDITNLPSTNRQIRDVIRIDPRVSVGRSGDGGDQAGAISCLGGSSRTNSFTVDGVRATDAFGLNLSGNLARFTFPIPFDTVDAAAVEFAPVSVEYGQFSGCNINVVTKSGGNEFHGSVFYLFNDESLTGDAIDGVPANLLPFERKNWGVEISGPIIQDKLFFYVSYEETDTASVNEVGTADSDFAIKTALTTAEVNRIRDILINSYGRDPGEVVTNLPVVSERIFTRFDWNINDNHRLEGNYSKLEESTIIGDDINTGRGAFTFSDNFHTRGSDSETIAVRLYSNWNDRLSTEVRYSTQEVLDLQDPLGGGEAQAENIARIVIGPGSPFGGGNLFASGPGTFRSANKLTTNKDQFKLKADYQLGAHKITAGYEYETLDVFNLFIANGTGSVIFDDIDALEAGTARTIQKLGSFTGDPNDAAVVFTRDIHSLFIQDEWEATDNLVVTYGLRYDAYKTDDLPSENPNYVARYGISNRVSFDGLDAIQPRLGMNYELPLRFGDTRISAGFGVFSGNDPTVWFSNAYQGFGGALGFGADFTGCPAGTLDVLAGGSFQGIPQCVDDAAQAGALANAGATDATDPDFDLPTVHRYSFGIEHNSDFESDFLSDWLVKFDVIYSDLKDSIDLQELTLTQTGTAPDGRPTYGQVDPLAANCNATFNGIRQGFSGVTADCFGSGRRDSLLTNTVGGDGHTFTMSVQASKLFEFSNDWTLNIGGGYAYNESEAANPGDSFRAPTTFESAVTSDLQNVPVGTSFRNVPHNFTLQGTLSKDFIADHKTSITAFLNVRAGASLSPTFIGGTFGGSIGDVGGRDRNLLYVPTDASDPLVNFDPGFDSGAFFAWVDAEGFERGAIAGVGSLEEDWQTDLDIRIQQEIPFFRESKIRLFLDIENVLNLLSDERGVKSYYNVPSVGSAVGVVSGQVDPADASQYLYTSFTAPVEIPDTFDSLYKIQFGIRGEF